MRSDGTVSYSIRFDDGEERQNIGGNQASDMPVTIFNFYPFSLLIYFTLLTVYAT